MVCCILYCYHYPFFLQNCRVIHKRAGEIDKYNFQFYCHAYFTNYGAESFPPDST